MVIACEKFTVSLGFIWYNQAEQPYWNSIFYLIRQFAVNEQDSSQPKKKKNLLLKQVHGPDVHAYLVANKLVCMHSKDKLEHWHYLPQKLYSQNLWSVVNVANAK